MAGVKFPFGLRNGRYVHISLVNSGLSDCVCPGCKHSFIAYKGSTAHHFAHKAKSDCTYQPETVLHKYAKGLIAAQKQVLLPKLLVVASNHEFSVEVREEIPAKTITVTAAYEELVHEDIVPDVQLDSTDGWMFAEVAVTHFVDREKRAKLRRIAIPTVEIDLSSVPFDAPLEVIDAAILTDVALKKWVYHPLETEIKERLNQKLLGKIQAIELSYAQSDNWSYSGNSFLPYDQDGEGWRLLEQSANYSHDVSVIDRALRGAPEVNRMPLYRSLDDIDKLMYHCYLLQSSPKSLPDVFNQNNAELLVFGTSSVVWRSGVFLRFVEKTKRSLDLEKF